MHDDLDPLMEKYGIDALLTEGNAFGNPNIYWLTGFRSSDSIIYLKNRGEEPLAASAFLAIERVKKESFIKKTHDLSEVYLQLLKENKKIRDNMDRAYDDLLKKQFSGKLLGVPDEFPASLLVMLQEMGYEIKVVRDLVSEARATKSTKEIEIIRKAGNATTDAISHIIEIVKDCDIGSNKVLMYNGEPLTVGIVKNILDHFLLDRGAESAEDVILAVGEKAFDWHYLGEANDKLKSEVPIILDVFPRLKQERYIADVTRTFVKGPVPKRVREMFEAVEDAANATVDALTDGVVIDDVNMACFKTLEKHGFDSRRLNPDAKDGMTHGLGHGIGLEVHELPSTYSRQDLYAEGHVMAIEPGVYLESIGGVRIENDYAVTKGKAKRLTTGIEDVLYI
ncbi:MAG: Xaa-Pro peptidase family protein [Candidatus Thorarchaeota archaeon]|nr:Xaa-Pro peptidase family protein [Candidatus Thorarchaeota archaeon]